MHIWRILTTVGYTMDIVYFSWLESPVEVDEDLQLPQFELKDTIQRDCSQNYTAGTSQRALQISFLNPPWSRSEHKRRWLFIIINNNHIYSLFNLNALTGSDWAVEDANELRREWVKNVEGCDGCPPVASPLGSCGALYAPPAIFGEFKSAKTLLAAAVFSILVHFCIELSWIGNQSSVLLAKAWQ